MTRLSWKTGERPLQAWRAQPTPGHAQLTHAVGPGEPDPVLRTRLVW